MLTVTQALEIIQREVAPFAPEHVPLADALGLVLAEDAVSDVDSPAFDKALMDGFAIRADDLKEETTTLRVIEEITAGRVPTKKLAAGDASRVMTGAPIPEGADTVVPIELVKFDVSSQIVSMTTANIRPRSNIMRKAATLKVGDRILGAGRKLRPQELGALAEIGKHRVAVRGRPRVAVLATGDELVPIDVKPGPGQIRNSNETLLVAQLQRAGAIPVPLGVARDERTELATKIRAGLECDMLLLSGGVSAGVLDLVPSELNAAGVREIFHKVDVKPGKPIWFGKRENDSKNKPTHGHPWALECYVFGLPGNPVSTLVCFELFVRPAIRCLVGVEPWAGQIVQARLTEEHIARGDRPTYHPARLEWKAGGPIVSPVPWQGSSDLQATVNANSMCLFPPGDRKYARDELVDVISWDES